MADAARSLEDIKASMQHNLSDLDSVKDAIAGLCDHLIAQKAEINAIRKQQEDFQSDAPTLGQIEAMRGR